jgi:hypothetical protein
MSELQTAPDGAQDITSPNVRNGNGYLTADQAEQNAAKDLIERDVEGVFGGKVRVRSLTAAQSAKVEQAGVKMSPGGRVQMSIPENQIAKFREGVLIPAFDDNAARRLFQRSGPSFQKVLRVIDEISGTSDQEALAAQNAFPGSEED